MSVYPSTFRSTGPTSLQLASGGVLAEWLLGSSSRATHRQKAIKNQAQQGDGFQDCHRAASTAYSKCDQELRTTATRKDMSGIETPKVSRSFRPNGMEEGQTEILINDDLLCGFLTAFDDTNHIRDRDQRFRTSHTFENESICDEISNYPVEHQLSTAQTMNRSAELRKSKSSFMLDTVINLPCNSNHSKNEHPDKFPSLDKVIHDLSAELTNTLTDDNPTNDYENEFQSRCKRCRLSDTSDDELHNRDEMMNHMKENIETRANGYLHVVRKHMPQSWIHTTLQNSLKRLSFRSKFIDDKGSLSLWIIDLLTILQLCKLTSFANVSLDFPSFTLEVLIGILSLISNFDLSKTVSSISLPFDEDETARTHRFRRYGSQSEKNAAFSKSLARFPAVVQSYTNIQCLRVRSKNEKLLRCLQHLQLSSLMLTSSHLKNTTILNSFLGFHCPREDGQINHPEKVTAFDMHGKPLSTSLKTLHIPKCRVTVATYNLLIQIFPNLTDLEVKPKLEILPQPQLNPIVSTNLDELPDTNEPSKPQFRSLYLKCNELSRFDIISNFPFLQHLSVQISNADDFQKLSVVNELNHLESLELKSLPSFTDFYRPIELDNVYPFLKKKLESIPKLTLQNFDISTDSLRKLSTLKLSSLSLQSCWIRASEEECRKISMFKHLTELHLTSIPSRSATTCLLSGGSVEHLSLVPQNNEMQVSVTSATERSLVELLTSGNLASLVSLTISSYFLSHSIVQQLRLLPRLHKVTAVEQPGASACDLLKSVSMTPSHITFCSEL